MALRHGTAAGGALRAAGAGAGLKLVAHALEEVLVTCGGGESVRGGGGTSSRHLDSAKRALGWSSSSARARARPCGPDQWISARSEGAGRDAEIEPLRAPGGGGTLRRRPDVGVEEQHVISALKETCRVRSQSLEGASKQLV